MKTKPTFVLCLAALCGLTIALHAQTPPLTPSGPPSDPATAMKSLNQIEPRTIISSLPYTISQPGSYYFTGNLEFTAASGNAITVSASNVTIDLMGFTLSSTANVTGSGIRISDGLKNIAVTNGVITGTTTVTGEEWTVVGGGFQNGVDASAISATSCRFANLSISGCRYIGLFAPSESVLENVTASSNGGGGILSYRGVVRGCSVLGNGSGGNGVNCGIQAGVVESSLAKGNEGTGIYADTVTGCSCESNGSRGILGSCITNCSAWANKGEGIHGLTVSYCHSSQSSLDGIVVSGGVVSFCTSNNNVGRGIVAINSVVSFSVARNNVGGQIDATTTTRTGNNPAP